MESEVHTSDGRLDSVVHTPSHIYLLEFKINQSAAAALQQMEEKRYADRYRTEGKTLVGLGINFTTDKRAIEGWVSKVL
jgi:hypothetical protein